MTKDEIGNSAARLLLGQRLRRLRESRGVHSEDVARQTGLAQATLWRMEQGDARCRFKPDDVATLARFYSADKPTIDAMVELAKGARRFTWAGGYRDLLTPVEETYLDLEAYAVRLRCHVTAQVPELLQTEDYATALIRASRLLRSYDAARHTRVRLLRQEILTRDPQPARFEFLLDETALRRVVGRPAVLKAQLQALIDRAALPSVSVRVIPHQAGMCPNWETGAFTLLDFPTGTPFGALPRAVHLNDRGDHVLLDKPAAVMRYEEAWDDASAYALDHAGTQHLITDTVNQLLDR